MSSRSDPMLNAKAGINARKRDSVLATIEKLKEAADIATLDNNSAIARLAGVHRNYVAAFAADIEKARAEVNAAFMSGRTAKGNLAAASLRADYETLKQFAAQQSDELRRLRTRLAAVLGDEVAAEHLGTDHSAEVVELRDANERLGNKVVELEIQLRDVQEELEAARRTTRRMMRERNVGEVAG